jgi:hypothetical protein
MTSSFKSFLMRIFTLPTLIACTVLAIAYHLAIRSTIAERCKVIDGDIETHVRREINTITARHMRFFRFQAMFVTIPPEVLREDTVEVMADTWVWVLKRQQ